MVIGGLYITKCFWLLYPSMEMAIEALPGPALPQRSAAAWWAAYYNSKYNCNITIIPENTYLIILEEHEVLKKVLDYEGNIGWIEIDDSHIMLFDLIQ